MKIKKEKGRKKKGPFDDQRRQPKKDSKEEEATFQNLPLSFSQTPQSSPPTEKKTQKLKLNQKLPSRRKNNIN